MNKIRITKLEVFANHGVFTEENKLGQKFIVDLEIGFNTQVAGYSDQVEDSVHYGEAIEVVVRALTNKTFNLIESCVEEINQQLYLTFPTIETLDVQVSKPWAPLKQHLESVSIQSSLTKNICYISMGANMGNCDQTFNNAIEKINLLPLTKVIAESPRIVTKAYGKEDQDDFLNSVIKIETMLLADTLLTYLNQIEADLGRVRIEKWGPRIIDLDIIIFGDLVINSERLIIPHPESHLRKFVIEPLLELNPYAIHPLTNKYYRDYLKELEQ